MARLYSIVKDMIDRRADARALSAKFWAEGPAAMHPFMSYKGDLLSAPNWTSMQAYLMTEMGKFFRRSACG